MVVSLVKSFQFDSSHRLPMVPAGHKCGRVHGHTFRVEVEVTGEVDPRTGWLIDYADIKAAFAPLNEQLDHRYLNDVEGLSNPTSEVLAGWIWERLLEKLPQISRVTVWETETSRCDYRGA